MKIPWNYFYLNWYWGNLHAEAQVNFVSPHGLDRRTDQDVNFMYYDGVPPGDDCTDSARIVATVCTELPSANNGGRSVRYLPPLSATLFPYGVLH